MKVWVAKKTLKFRHSIVKLIAPTLYGNLKIKALCFPRSMIRFLHRKFSSKSLSGVEIGVSIGQNAESILETLNIHKLFLVDPYIPFTQGGTARTVYASYHAVAKERLVRFKDKTVFIQKTSIDAVDDIPNDLDFVYIDGNHDYSFIKDDIKHYYPKVRIGGVIGGHDFDRYWLGVKKAVAEFVHANDLTLHTEISDWWVIKK